MRNRKWEAKLVSVLAEEHEVVEGRSVFVNQNNTLQFYLKIISYEPNDFPRNVRHITCYAEELEKWGFEDDLTLNDYERTERIKEFLKESLLVFQPQLKISSNFREFHVATNVYLIGKKESFTRDVSLIPIPVFEEEDGIDEEEFKSRLLERNYIGDNPDISKHEEDTPSFLVWKDKKGSIKIYGEFESHTVAHGGFRFIEKGKLKELNCDQKFLQHVYDWEGGAVWFFPDYLNEEVLQELSKSSPVYQQMEEDKVSQAFVVKEAVEDNNKEEEFLQEFIAKTKELGLFYSERDLYNFHIALKTQSLVILAGMSGTGKSQLVHAYAKALRLPTSQVSFIPVRPSWTDDTDLIGYPDTLHNVYRPGDSGLVNTLIRAESEKDQLFIVCFDEMNLARVEHYFAQFLSLLETDNRVLKLYNEDLQHRFYNNEQYKPFISIRENVMFVGTVNIDETTHQFSDKVLDRANVIELEVLPYHQLLEIEEKKESKPNEKGSTSASEYASYRDKHLRSIQLTKEELSFLWDLHRLLQETSLKMGIGPRVVRQIDRYIKNMPVSCPFIRGEAVDFQILQRVLTKVRGPEEMLKGLVGVYIEGEDTVSESKLFHLFEKYSQVSDFILARTNVISKARELKLNGYTM